MKTRMWVMALALVALVAPAGAEERAFLIPSEGWRVVVDAPRLDKIEELRRGADYAVKGHGGLFNLSLFVEKPQSATGGHKECYEFFWAKGGRNPSIDQSSVRVSSSPRNYRVEYVTVTPFEGKKFRQKHVNYLFVFNGRWMDLHISVFEPKAGDEEIFRRFDQGLRYEMVTSGKAAPLVLVAGAGRLLAGNKVERTYPIPNGGTLVLAVPAVWKSAVAPPRDAMPDVLTVEFTRDNAAGFRVLLSVMPKEVAPDGRKPVGPWLRDMLEEGRRRAQADAEEKALVISEFKGGETVGCYYSATDRTVPRDNPPAGQARYMLQAAIMMGGRVAMLTALSNTAGNVDQNAALEMLKAARCR